MPSPRIIEPTVAYPVCQHAVGMMYVVTAAAMACLKQIKSEEGCSCRGLVRTAIPASTTAIIFLVATAQWREPVQLCKAKGATLEPYGYLAESCSVDPKEASCYSFPLASDTRMDVCGGLQDELDAHGDNDTLKSQWSDHNCSDDQFHLLAALLEDKPFFQEIDVETMRVMRGEFIGTKAWLTVDGEGVEANTVIGILFKTAGVIVDMLASADGCCPFRYLAVILDMISTSFLWMTTSLQLSDRCFHVPSALGGDLMDVAGPAFTFALIKEAATISSIMYKLRNYFCTLWPWLGLFGCFFLGEKLGCGYLTSLGAGCVLILLSGFIGVLNLYFILGFTDSLNIFVLSILAGLTSPSITKKANAVLQICPVLDVLLEWCELLGLNDLFRSKFGILSDWCKAPRLMELFTGKKPDAVHPASIDTCIYQSAPSVDVHATPEDDSALLPKSDTV